MQVRSDPQQPNAGRRRLAQLVPRLPAAQQRLLRQVLRLLGVARESQGVSVDRVGVCCHEVVHRACWPPRSVHGRGEVGGDLGFAAGVAADAFTGVADDLARQTCYQ